MTQTPTPPSQQKDNWTFSDEREFMENLLCRRFNFFLVFFSLVVLAAIESGRPWIASAILALGAVVSFLMTLTLWRAQTKLDRILMHLDKQKKHPCTVIDNEVGRAGSRRKLIGKVVPVVCTVALVLGSLGMLVWMVVDTVVWLLHHHCVAL